jgi:hypothetical protein
MRNHYLKRRLTVSMLSRVLALAAVAAAGGCGKPESKKILGTWFFADRERLHASPEKQWNVTVLAFEFQDGNKVVVTPETGGLHNQSQATYDMTTPGQIKISTTDGHVVTFASTGQRQG